VIGPPVLRRRIACLAREMARVHDYQTKGISR